MMPAVCSRFGQPGRLHEPLPEQQSLLQVNWPTLWMSWRERELREFIVLPIIVLIMLVPIGAFSGDTPSA